MLLNTFTMHGTCTILHLMAVTACYKGHAILTTILMHAKTVIFIISIMQVQAFLLGNEGS